MRYRDRPVASSKLLLGRQIRDSVDATFACSAYAPLRRIIAGAGLARAAETSLLCIVNAFANPLYRRRLRDPG